MLGLVEPSSVDSDRVLCLVRLPMHSGGYVLRPAGVADLDALSPYVDSVREGPRKLQDDPLCMA